MYQWEGGRSVSGEVAEACIFCEAYKREEAMRGPRISPDSIPSSVEFLSEYQRCIRVAANVNTMSHL